MKKISVFFYRYNDWKQLLHMAVEHGSSKLVNLILEKGPIDVHSSVRHSRVVPEYNGTSMGEGDHLPFATKYISIMSHSYMLCLPLHWATTSFVRPKLFEKYVTLRRKYYKIEPKLSLAGEDFQQV